MHAAEISIFGVILFFALVALLLWKRRRDDVDERLSHTLRGYFAVQDIPEPTVADETDHESLTKVA